MTRVATDKELCELVRRHAAAQGIPLADFLAPVTLYGATAIINVEKGKKFSAARCAVLIAYLAKQPPVDMTIPAPKPKVYRERNDATRATSRRKDYAVINPVTGRTAAEDERLRLEKLFAESVDRTPCPWCAVRADVGCAHSRRLAA